MDTNLHVVLHNATFAKPYSYFLTVKVDDERDTQKSKFRTEVSADVAQPQFKMNSFVFHITPDIYEANPDLLVEVYVVMKEGAETDRSDAKGSARYLGGATIPLRKVLKDLVGSPDTKSISENMSFTRNTESQGEITVGKVTVELFATEPTGSTDRDSATPSSGTMTPVTTQRSPKPNKNKKNEAAAGSPAAVGMSQTMPVAQLNLMTDRVSSLAADIQNKQSLIDRLLNEVDQRTDAIRMCGVEIVDLRKNMKILQQDNMDLRRRLHEGERPVDVDKVKDVPLEELQKKYMTLLKEFKSECMRNEDLGARVDLLNAEVAKMDALERKHRDLEDAHQMQNMYIQNMQDKAKKIGKYKRTVRNQEKVILQLEKLVESSMHDVRQLKDLKKENDELRTVVQDLEADIVKMKTVGHFKSVSSIPAAVEERDQDIIDLKKQKSELEAKVSDLERQLKAKEANDDTVSQKGDGQGSEEDKKTIEKLNNEIKRLEESLNRERMKNAAANESDQMREMEEELVKHMLRAEQAEGRIKIMDDQMKQSQEKSGQEIFQLKLKIAELESQSAAFGGPIASNLDFDSKPEDMVDSLTRSGLLTGRTGASEMEGGGSPMPIGAASHITGGARNSMKSNKSSKSNPRTPASARS